MPPIRQFFWAELLSLYPFFITYMLYSCSSSCCELFVSELGSFIFCFSSFSVSFHTTQKSKGSVLVLVCYNICLVTVKWFRKIYIAGDFMNDEYTSRVDSWRIFCILCKNWSRDRDLLYKYFIHFFYKATLLLYYLDTTFGKGLNFFAFA